MTAEFAHFSNQHRMTEAEYQRQRGEIRSTYGDNKDQAGVLAEQALAKLFHRSQWDASDLARAEGKSESWVSRRKLFGEFLVDLPTGKNARNLTEWRFREYWGQIDPVEKNHHIRFLAIQKLIEDDTVLSKPTTHKKGIGEAIKATCAGGAWHKLATITAKVQEVVKEATQADVESVLKGMIRFSWYNCFCEPKKEGSKVYRIVIGGKQKVDLVVLQKELGPLIHALYEEGKKNEARYSPQTVGRIAWQIERLLERWTKETPSEGVVPKE